MTLDTFIHPNRQTRSLLGMAAISLALLACIGIAVIALYNAVRSPVRYTAVSFPAHAAWYCPGETVIFSPDIELPLGGGAGITIIRTLWRVTPEGLVRVQQANGMPFHRPLM